jgi:hypothetical protein
MTAGVGTDELRAKIKILSEEIWERQAQREHVDLWLDNFAADVEGATSERLHALFLLSQFMYFGPREIRELLKALFRDLYAYPIIAEIRRDNGDTRDASFLNAEFAARLSATRFLGVGNPSESGQHLLYYFRQQNALSKDLFLNTHEMFSRDSTGSRTVRKIEVTRYVFIDDFCGSGTQAKEYSEDLLRELKQLNPAARAYYYCLFATKAASELVEAETEFDEVRSVFELDDSYKVFHEKSRYFAACPSNIDPAYIAVMCQKYGSSICPAHPLGYKDSQLLIGFMHNVPDNTLPVVWADGSTGASWTPMFRRYPKLESASA